MKTKTVVVALIVLALSSCKDPLIGPKGEKGDKGDTGATGSAGANGSTGSTGNTGAAGTPANVYAYLYPNQSFATAGEGVYNEQEKTYTFTATKSFVPANYLTVAPTGVVLTYIRIGTGEWALHSYAASGILNGIKNELSWSSKIFDHNVRLTGVLKASGNDGSALLSKFDVKIVLVQASVVTTATATLRHLQQIVDLNDLVATERYLAAFKRDK